MKNNIAIFICGSGGSGKSTFVKNNLKEYAHIDVDIIYEELLVSNGLGLNIKNFSEAENELASKLFEKSKELNNLKLKANVQSGNNLVIDGIGRYSDVILSQKLYLENYGYQTYMIMLYVDLNICIDRIENRERVYNQNLTKDSWYLSYNNIGTYKKEFGDKFAFIYNNNSFKLDNFLNSSNKLTHSRSLI
jgi:predicted kinase